MKSLHLSTTVIAVFASLTVLNINIVSVEGSSFDRQTAYFRSDSVTYPIPYQIINATLTASPMDIHKSILYFEINATSNGQLIVELPRSIIDSKDGTRDKPYYVTIFDIRSIGYPTSINPEEINASDVRTLKIDFTEGIKEIAITGTFFAENEKPPVIITQVELDSPFLFFPDNQTCSSQRGYAPQYTCLTDLVPRHKVACTYFLGSSHCEPLHKHTRGTNKSCLGSHDFPSAPQWFDMYNTENETAQIQLFDVKILQGARSWGNFVIPPTTENLKPHEGCTFGIGAIDEPLSLDQKNMGIVVSYIYEGKNYTVSTPPLTDLYNDSRTWQFDAHKWTFAEQNSVAIPEFPVNLMIITGIGLIGVVIALRLKSNRLSLVK